MSFLILILIIGGGFLSGCKDDRIVTYRLAKETAPMASVPPDPMASAGGSAMPMLPGMAPAATPGQIHWRLPEGWQEQAPSAMRLGSFLIVGKNGQKADVSVVPLTGDAGGDLANINRWRG